MSRNTWIAAGAAATAVTWLLFLLFLPVPVAPTAWRPPAPPARTGVLAPNERLRGVERIGAPEAVQPEATVIDPDGHVVAGLGDGRVVRIDPRSGTVTQIAATGGRPLGLAFDSAGRLHVCDAVKGLLRISPSGEVTVLATGQGGLPFGFTDDLSIAADGTVYFTDATWRFGPGTYRDDILEHGGSGRLLAFDPRTGQVSLLLSGLQFANGVALSGDGSFLLVAETGSYRLVRYWLAGPRRGTSEPFVENLPGFPDNVTWSPDRKVFWVALWPRVAAVDALAPYPFLRKVVRRLPRWLQPDPAPHAWVVAIDENGRIVDSLEWLSPESYFPVTSVREQGGWLWLGSLAQNGVGRIAAPPVTPSPPRP
jgi:sugar lactone lactonase YvrE